MIRFVSINGTLVDPVLEARDEAMAAKRDVKTPGHFFPIDVRRHAAMKFMTEVGLTLEDRMMSDEVQGIIDSALFIQADDQAA